MAEFSDYLEVELLDHAFGGAGGAWTAPTTVYLALITATASDTDTCATITEPSTGGYARKTLSFAAASAGSKATNAAVTFTNGAATAWNVVGVAIVDSLAGVATTNKVLCFDNDMTDATINQSEKLQFASGDITISLN